MALDPLWSHLWSTCVGQSRAISEAVGNALYGLQGMGDSAVTTELRMELFRQCQSESLSLSLSHLNQIWRGLWQSNVATTAYPWLLTQMSAVPQQHWARDPIATQVSVQLFHISGRVADMPQHLHLAYQALAASPARTPASHMERELFATLRQHSPDWQHNVMCHGFETPPPSCTGKLSKQAPI